MIVEIEKGIAHGRVKVPPSKSMAHRYLICGALSELSEISGVDFSEDIKATLYCLAALGADIEISGNTVKLGGALSDKGIKARVLKCGESGSTLRFMIPLCLLTGRTLTLKGTERLMQRSLSVYGDICKSQNIKFEQATNYVKVKGVLSSGVYSVRGDVSSQFISGLMFALPRLQNDSIIDITGAVESNSYLGLTVKALADFGVRISRKDENTVYIKGGQTYKKRCVSVEGDYSNAAFLDALNLFGGNVALSGLKKDSIQGDAVYKDYFSRIQKANSQIDLTDCPDLAPVLMAVAAAHHGAVFTGTHRLKIKESDRGRVMAEELNKFGIKCVVEENKITVFGGKLKTPEQPLYGHNDHRIVMSLAILCTVTGGRIFGAEAVSKSFPDFFDKLNKLGIRTKAVELNET